MSNTGLSIRHLEFKYPDKDELCLNDINLHLDYGQCFLLTGPSGCGKTTLINIICGIIPNLIEGEVKGEVFIDDIDLKTLEPYQIAPLIGCVFQNPRSQFFTEYTTSELVFAQENLGINKSEMEKTIHTLCDLLGIESLLDKSLFTLSMGERQLIAIACAMTLGQKILIFDEPSANLDYANAMHLGKIIESLKSQGIACIVCDHRYFYLDGVVDTIAYLGQGSLASYTTQDSFIDAGYPGRRFNILDNAEALFCERQHDLNKKDAASQDEDVRKDEKTAIAELKQVSYKGVLKDINLSLFPHEILCVVGANGVGKTTVANLICRSIKPSSGEISYPDHVFYVAQDADYQLFGSSVFNECFLAKDPPDKQVVLDTLELMDIDKLKDKHPFEISGGEKQRLQIALSMLSHSDLIIFDEPTSGLDYKRMQMVIDLIEQLRLKSSILIITHDFDLCLSLADRICFIRDGVIEQDFYLNTSTLDNLLTIFNEMESRYEQKA